MATFEIGDIVTVTGDITIRDEQNNECRVKDCEARVAYTFTDFGDREGYIIEFTELGFQSPFLAADLALKEKAVHQEPAQEQPTIPDGHRIIDGETYDQLCRLGILDTSVRSYNRGASDYSQHLVQPWTIWQDYGLNPWDADIVKRVLRHKQGDSRQLDYEKIIHICEERIRQIRQGAE